MKEKTNRVQKILFNVRRNSRDCLLDNKDRLIRNNEWKKECLAEAYAAIMTEFLDVGFEDFRNPTAVKMEEVKVGSRDEHHFP